MKIYKILNLSLTLFMTEMRTLMKSLLRVNDDRVATMKAFENKENPNKYRYKFEVHVFFDNGYAKEIDGNEKKVFENTEDASKRPFNAFVKALIQEVMTKDINEVMEYSAEF